MATSSPTLIVYGGGFDPPHQGHVDVVNECLRTFPEAKILVMPDRQPAGAGGHHKVPVAGLAARLAMCELAMAATSDRVTVSSLADWLPTPNYTLTGLLHLRGLYPKMRLGVLIGQDQLKTFNLWHKPLEVLQTADLIVHRRVEDSESEPLPEQATAVLGALGVTLEWVEAGTHARLGAMASPGNLYLLNNKISPAQSSHLRAAFESAGEAPKGWLPGAVLTYIKDKRLYGL